MFGFNRTETRIAKAVLFVLWQLADRLPFVFNQIIDSTIEFAFAITLEFLFAEVMLRKITDFDYVAVCKHNLGAINKVINRGRLSVIASTSCLRDKATDSFEWITEDWQVETAKVERFL